MQFPDPLLREAPEVLWTLQARLRKLRGAEGGGEKEEPLIFVTGDTSYGSCCVDEVSAQHLKADAIVHYGEAGESFDGWKGAGCYHWSVKVPERTTPSNPEKIRN